MRKYFWIELGFILFLTFGLMIITDLEYSAYEQHNILRFTEGLRYRTITAVLLMISMGAFYWLLLKPAVFKRNIAGYLIAIVVYVVFFHFYNHYVLKPVYAGLKGFLKYSKDFVWKTNRGPGFAVNFGYQLISTILPLSGLAFWVRSLTLGDQMRTLKEQQLSSELKYLKAQLHPHFFFNTINNIYSLALKQSTNTAPMVARLGDLMRYILYEADHGKVSLRREIDFLLGYVEVEQLRHGKNIDIQFDVQGIQPATQIEPLLLLPFIENAFKHGLEQETGSGYVRIVVCQTEKELLLDVTNSKPSQQTTPATNGVGLANVRKRLELLYPGKHKLTIKEEADKYQSILTLQQV